MYEQTGDLRRKNEDIFLKKRTNLNVEMLELKKRQLSEMMNQSIQWFYSRQKNQ